MSTPAPATTPGGIQRSRELGLDALEIQFVQGVKMGERSALVVREVAQRAKVKLSAHAPYFVNLNAHEPEKVVASEGRLLQTARIAHLCGAESIVFHAAFYLGDPPPQVYARVKGILEKLVNQLRREGNPVILRPEVMGKGTQFGTWEEVLNLSAEIEGVLPALDFSHWHARIWDGNSYEAFLSQLTMVEARLGRQGLERLHLHLSGIAYGKGGEIKHLLLKDSDLRYRELLKALKDKQAQGVVICESPNLEGDALLLKEAYNSLS